MVGLPPLAAVRVFEAAARHENFSRAAEELGMTQAGVSYQIKVLEDRLGVRLFARKGRAMELTATGRRLAPRVSDAFSELASAFGVLRRENESVLTISASATIATCWLSPRLGSFQLRHPGLAVRVDASDQLVDLEGGEFDLAIRTSVQPGPELERHFLMRQIFVPMATPAYIAEHALHRPEDLGRASRISPDDHWWQLWFERLADPTAVVPQPTGVRFDSQVLGAQAALAGHGVAILNIAMFRRELESGQLVAPFDCHGTELRSIWLCYSPLKRHLAKVRAFRDWIIEEAREAVGSDPCGVLVPPALA